MLRTIRRCNRVIVGTCSNGSGIFRPAKAERLLSGLKNRLQAREPVAEAMRTQAEEINRECSASDACDRKAQADVEKKITAKIAAMENGSCPRQRAAPRRYASSRTLSGTWS